MKGQTQYPRQNGLTQEVFFELSESDICHLISGFVE